MTPSSQQLLRHFESNDPKIAGIIRQVGPYRLQAHKRYFIVLCRAIISQQISTKAADSIFRRFHGVFGGRVPTPDRVGEIDEEQLRSVGLSRQKVAYLKDLSRHFLNQSIRPRQLPHLDNEEVIQVLTAVHGVGRWTAEMFLIFSLNRQDVLPVADLGLQSALKKVFNLPGLPSAQWIRNRAERWTPYETAATWYLWRSLNPEITAY